MNNQPTMQDATTPWWQTAVIYQVYPRSFQDTNGDGVGDLKGILERLEYLADLGVDAVWISPFYPSPMADFGYDVADYTDVDPIFGTLADFDRLLARAHALGLRVILDFVPNHTSDRHPWFLDSRSSRSSERRAWYIWRDPEPGPGDPAGRPPNNWMSHFGGTAWTFDRTTGQFYLHSFLPEQPDLNWRNQEVRKAIYDAMLFWLERGEGGRGVDGFRMDVLWLLIKDAYFRDNPLNPEWQAGGSSFGRFLPVYTADRPETHEIVAEMRMLLDSCAVPVPGSGRGAGDDPRLLIGEIYLPIEDLVRYYGSSVPAPTSSRRDMTNVAMTSPHLNGAQLPFNFHLIQTPWRTSTIAQLIRDYEAALPAGAWPNWVLGNHDQSRLATRLGPGQARTAAMLLLTLRGTPTMYYGDELGMRDGQIPPARIQDPAEKRQPGIGMGRDPERTPMLWDGSANAGFTTAAQPWLPIAGGFAAQSVAAQTKDPQSMLGLYRRLLALRRAHAALHSGAISDVAPRPGAQTGVLSYVRSGGGERVAVYLNLTNEAQSAEVPAGRVLLSTSPAERPAEVKGTIRLEAAEGLVVLIG
ncbi:MAG: alpha-amylase family glycosyl hydrolase [Acidobacteriota bacterium]|nr:alpha-amylase family glycosyl hydrolase [Acidobacteriota bacterium]